MPVRHLAVLLDADRQDLGATDNRDAEALLCAISRAFTSTCAPCSPPVAVGWPAASVARARCCCR